MDKRLASLVLAIAMLSACGKREDAPIAVSDPPKPPNCPKENAEIENITLASGEIADVRVIRDRNLTLYIPTDWFEDRFKDENPSTFGCRGRFTCIDPLISRNECPGVIHSNFPNPGRRFALMLHRPHANPPKSRRYTNRHPDSALKELRVFRVSDMTLDGRPRKLEDHILDWPTRQNPRANIVFDDGKYVIQYAWPQGEPMGTSRWNDYRQSALRLVEWLTTPPRFRNSEAIF